MFGCFHEWPTSYQVTLVPPGTDPVDPGEVQARMALIFVNSLIGKTGIKEFAKGTNWILAMPLDLD